MIDSHQYFHRSVFIIIFIGFISLIQTGLSIQFHINNFEDVIAQSLATNTSIANDNLQETNKSKMIRALGHFANNQIKDGIVTWIQGGFWELTVTNINMTSSNSSNNFNKNDLSIDKNGKADFNANFTMIKPDGTNSHSHNIGNFIADKVIITDKDIVVMGVADIYSDDNGTEYKSVPLTIHLMGKKVLGLTIDVSKTEAHFSSQNEMYGTLISGVGLGTSSNENNSAQIMMHGHDSTNETTEKEHMTMMQH